MNYQIEIMLLLKYGTKLNAIKVWNHSWHKEDTTVFTMAEGNVIREWIWLKTKGQLNEILDYDSNR